MVISIHASVEIEGHSTKVPTTGLRTRRLGPGSPPDVQLGRDPNSMMEVLKKTRGPIFETRSVRTDAQGPPEAKKSGVAPRRAA